MSRLDVALLFFIFLFFLNSFSSSDEVIVISVVVVIEEENGLWQITHSDTFTLKKIIQAQQSKNKEMFRDAFNIR